MSQLHAHSISVLYYVMISDHIRWPLWFMVFPCKFSAPCELHTDCFIRRFSQLIPINIHQSRLSVLIFSELHGKSHNFTWWRIFQSMAAKQKALLYPAEPQSTSCFHNHESFLGSWHSPGSPKVRNDSCVISHHHSFPEDPWIHDYKYL